MKKAFYLRSLPLLFFLFSCAPDAREPRIIYIPEPPDTTAADTNNDNYDPSTNNGTWTLVWNDEFNLTNYSRPDSSKWNIETRTGASCGTGELEYLTDRSANSYIINGTLVMKAISEYYLGYYFTSSRLNTKGKYTVNFGKVAARIQLPFGYGTWPAFWMMGTNMSYSNEYWKYPNVIWPTNGEIDIMENRGDQPSTASGALHGPGYSGSSCKTSNLTLSSGQFTNSFHYFEVIWKSNDSIKLYVDGSNFFTMTKAYIVANYGSSNWVFDQGFFILLDLAIGGTMYGTPPAVGDITAIFPQYLFIDWIRVYTN